MNRKNIPVILPLFAGAVSMLLGIIRGDTLLRRLVVLFIVLLVFHLLGQNLKNVLDYFDEQNEKKRAQEGEMVEKDADGNPTDKNAEKNGKADEQKE